VEEHGKDNLIVIIGAPDADSAELYAETVTHGDPTWAGSLAGVALELPVYHMMEPEIMAQVDPAAYKEHLSIMEIALDVDKITQGLQRVRNKTSSV
jgi:glycine/sarcosine/betaine reductase complex component A